MGEYQLIPQAWELNEEALKRNSKWDFVPQNTRKASSSPMAAIVVTA